MSNSGIYRIINKINNDTYIGSSINVYNRKYTHFFSLRKGKHSNKHLQAAFNKYGEINFVFEVLIFCDIENLILYEQLFINTLNPKYNKRKVANSNFGIKFSEKTKQEISKRLKGNKYALGMRHTEEIKKKMRERMLGIKLSEEHINKAVAGRIKNRSYSLISPDGILYLNIKNLSAFAKERDLDVSDMYAVHRGVQKSYHGWTKF